VASEIIIYIKRKGCIRKKKGYQIQSHQNNILRLKEMKKYLYILTTLMFLSSCKSVGEEFLRSPMPFVWTFFAGFLTWIILGARGKLGFETVIWRKIRSRNTRTLIDRYYNGEILEVSSLINSEIDDDGPYAKIYWSVRQRNILTIRCPYCKVTHYGENDFSYVRTSSESIMTNGRITKKGDFDDRYNTRFETIYTYHYTKKCPHCGKLFSFDTDSELRHFPNEKIIYTDINRADNISTVIISMFLMLITVLIPAVVFISSYAYEIDRNPIELIKEKVNHIRKNGLFQNEKDNVSSEAGRAGLYYVSDSAFNGIIVYKDKSRSVRFDNDLPSMEPVNVISVQDGMGYTQYVQGQYIEEGAWIDIRDLIPVDIMFTEADKGIYTVTKKLKKGVYLYRDRGRKSKYPKKIPVMKEIEIIKVVDGMGYTTRLTSRGSDTLKGWLEMKNLIRVK
jgi:hypothetical protein